MSGKDGRKQGERARLRGRKGGVSRRAAGLLVGVRVRARDRVS